MVGLHIGDDDDLAGVLQEGPVGLVGLDDEGIPSSQMCRASTGGQRGADDVGRIHAGVGEDAGDDGAGRRLAVGTGHRHALMVEHECCQGGAAMPDPQTESTSLEQFRVVVVNGRGHHNRACPVDVGGIVPHPGAHTHGRERLQTGRVHLVGPRHLRPQLSVGSRHTTHAGPTNGDEVHRADGARILQVDGLAKGHFFLLVAAETTAWARFCAAWVDMRSRPAMDIRASSSG